MNSSASPYRSSKIYISMSSMLALCLLGCATTGLPSASGSNFATQNLAGWRTTVSPRYQNWLKQHPWRDPSPSPAPTTSPTTWPTPAPGTSPSATPAPVDSPTPAPVVTPTPAPVGGIQPASGVQVFPAPAIPSTPYSLYVSTSGSDSNSGASPASPLRNIATAASRAKPGTTIYISPGTYYEHLTLHNGGTSGAPIIFEGYGGVPVIDGSRIANTDTSWGTDHVNYGVVEMWAPYITLYNLKIANSANSGVVYLANNETIQNCEVTNMQNDGITNAYYLNTASGNQPVQNISVVNDYVHDGVYTANGQGISVGATNFLVQGNTVDNINQIGIDLWMGGSNGEVVGNTVDHNAQVGIYVDGVNYLRIHHNWVHDNKHGITVSSEDTHYTTQHVWVYDNVIFNQTQGDGMSIWDPGPAPNTGAQDVLFANNTLFNNQITLYFAGYGNTAQVINNLGYTTGTTQEDQSTGSSYSISNNVWLTSVTGFVDVAADNFQLLSGSPAIDKGLAIPPFVDASGNQFPVTTDYAGNPRVVGSAPDAGAYEYQ